MARWACAAQAPHHEQALRRRRVFALPLARFEQVAIWILAGLMLGAGKVTTPKGGPEA
jgi:hypothetical protein